MNEDKIVNEVTSKNDIDSDDLCDNKPINRPKLSKFWEAVDTEISFIDASEEENVQQYYANFRRFKELIIKKQ